MKRVDSSFGRNPSNSDQTGDLVITSWPRPPNFVISAWILTEIVSAENAQHSSGAPDDRSPPGGHVTKIRPSQGAPPGPASTPRRIDDPAPKTVCPGRSEEAARTREEPRNTRTQLDARTQSTPIWLAAGAAQNSLFQNCAQDRS